MSSISAGYRPDMRIPGISAVVAVLGMVSGPSAAWAAEGCTPRAADGFARSQLLAYADKNAPEFYGQYGGSAELGYVRRTLLCRDLTGDGDREMIMRLLCCTGGSPTPWGVFQHDADGAWELVYARAVDTVFRLGIRRRAVRAMMPAPYEGACTRFVRFRIVRWRGSRFRSQVTSRSPVSNAC